MGYRARVMLKATMLALAMVLGATAAHAADACYQGVGGSVLVFKKFKLPRAGECSADQRLPAGLGLHR